MTPFELECQGMENVLTRKLIWWRDFYKAHHSGIKIEKSLILRHCERIEFFCQFFRTKKFLKNQMFEKDGNILILSGESFSSDFETLWERSFYLHYTHEFCRARKKNLELEASPRVLLGSLLTINRLIEVYQLRQAKQQNFHDLITAFLSTWNFLTKS